MQNYESKIIRSIMEKEVMLQIKNYIKNMQKDKETTDFLVIVFYHSHHLFI